MKRLCFILFLSALLLVVFLYFISEKNKVSTVIFSSKGEVYVGKSGNLAGAKKLKKFTEGVTGLVIYNDHVYVSVKCSYDALKRNSTIWRAKLDNSTAEFGVDDQSWEEFVVMNKYDHNIRRMAAANGHIYVVRTDGVMWRCSTEEKNKCNFFKQFDSAVTGIDFNPENNDMYVSLWSGELWRCTHPYNADDCEVSSLPVEHIMAMKIRSNSIWFGVTKKLAVGFSWLIECSIGEFHENYHCHIHLNHPELIKNIDATSRYLYLNFWMSNKIYRFDPSNNSSCSHLIPTDEFTSGPIGSMIIVENN